MEKRCPYNGHTLFPLYVRAHPDGTFTRPIKFFYTMISSHGGRPALPGDCPPLTYLQCAAQPDYLDGSLPAPPPYFEELFVSDDGKHYEIRDLSGERTISDAATMALFYVVPYMDSDE